jgi:hypothetical protein
MGQERYERRLGKQIESIFTCCQFGQLGREAPSLSGRTGSYSSDVPKRGDRLGPGG